ncbi:hypothetical protein H4R34_000286 [Dimargaris verticillata]|uniref:C2H2-type domain-containing protein n=1 Tax=Dimargaris verticillata TaxID=2761393 RepID=A0A9W8BC61_9FUNG|nr:hypothetical protein H4R34_000286 [Dimargaris verticillata]
MDPPAITPTSNPDDESLQVLAGGVVTTGGADQSTSQRPASPVAAGTGHSCAWDECHLEFSTVTDLSTHLENEHVPTGQRVYTCEWRGCPRRGIRQQTRFALLAHLRRHTGARPYRCQVPNCGKEYKRADALNKHYLSHGLSAPPDTPADLPDSTESDGDSLLADRNGGTLLAAGGRTLQAIPGTESLSPLVPPARRGRPKRKDLDADEGPSKGSTRGKRGKDPLGSEILDITAAALNLNYDEKVHKAIAVDYSCRQTKEHLQYLKEEFEDLTAWYQYLTHRSRSLKLKRKVFLDVYMEQQSQPSSTQLQLALDGPLFLSDSDEC